MARKGLVTTSVISMFAGELFLMHRNIDDHQIGWPIAFAAWLAFGIAIGLVGDSFYNKQLESGRANSFSKRLFLLLLIAAAIFLLAYIFSALMFAIF